jgi:DNA-binding MarR family transcriptional regulator
MVTIHEELGMGPDAISGPLEEAVLNLLHTSDMLLKCGNKRLFTDVLTQAQFNILMILSHEQEGICQRDLAQRVVVTKGNVSQHVANLEVMGLLRRRVSVDDHRYRVVTLTAKGRRQLNRLEPQYRRLVRDLFSELSAADMKSLTRILGKVRGCIRRMNRKVGSA